MPDNEVYEQRYAAAQEDYTASLADPDASSRDINDNYDGLRRIVEYGAAHGRMSMEQSLDHLDRFTTDAIRAFTEKRDLVRATRFGGLLTELEAIKKVLAESPQESEKTQTESKDMSGSKSDPTRA